jgi:4-hydroxybenzoate polyprenyltransferase
MHAREEEMQPQATLTAARLRAPRAAAIAGILFSILLIVSFVLLRRSVPADPLEAGAWLRTRANSVAAALNLVPFAGIAFLWFIGVLRDRLGEREDRFFATVFLGSGLLFLAMLFFSAAVAGGVIIAFTAAPDLLLGSATFTFARAIIYEIMNVYAIKMAGVFTIATSTLALRTGFIARWIAFLGYALALLLLFAGRNIDGILLVFPLWVLLVSLYILVGNLREPSRTAVSVLEEKKHD